MTHQIVGSPKKVSMKRPVELFAETLFLKNLMIIFQTWKTILLLKSTPHAIRLLMTIYNRKPFFPVKTAEVGFSRQTKCA